MFVIPPFSLERKRWSQKVQGKPEPLRASCRPRTATVTTAFIIHLLCTKQLVPVLKTAFSKPHAFSFTCNRLQALYPALLFIQ
jgi:hypothetical protein